MEPAFAVSSVGEAGLHGLRQQADVPGWASSKLYIRPYFGRSRSRMRGTASSMALARSAPHSPFRGARPSSRPASRRP